MTDVNHLRAECQSILQVLGALPADQVTAGWAEQRARFLALMSGTNSQLVQPVAEAFNMYHHHAFTVEGGSIGLDTVMNTYLWTL